jgi:hypothetical protein
MVCCQYETRTELSMYTPFAGSDGWAAVLAPWANQTARDLAVQPLEPLPSAAGSRTLA